MDGDSGADRIFGGPGDDEMQDGEDRGGPRDFLFGGSGDDALFPIQENPAAEDIVRCGGGDDIVFADRRDRISNDCETVIFEVPQGEV